MKIISEKTDIECELANINMPIPMHTSKHSTIIYVIYLY